MEEILRNNVNPNTSLINTFTESFISYSSKKKSKFKKTLINSLFFYDKHPQVLTLLKIILGFIILGIPAIFIVSLCYNTSPVPSKYLFLPNIVAITISIAAVIMVLVIKARYNLIQSGILISSWERLGILKLIGCMIVNCFILSILLRVETITINLPFYQGNVGQLDSGDFPAKQLTQGSFFFRLIFISLFWSPNNEHLGYFSIDNRFLGEFKDSLSHLFKSILSVAIYYLIKIIFIESKNTLAYLISTLVAIYECLLFIYYPIDLDYQYSNPFFFKYSKYFETIPLFGILFCYSWISIKSNVIKLAKKKLYSYRTKKKNYFTIVIVLLCFCCSAAGLLILLYVFIHLLFVKTERMYHYIFI